MLNSLLVLAGAIVGLAGGVFATIYAQHRQSKREKYKELRSNLLAVALESSKIYAWVMQETTYYTAASTDEIIASASQNPPAKVKPDPMQKIQAIVSLYFPEILAHARVLTIAGLRHRFAVVKLSQIIDEAERRQKVSQNDATLQNDLKEQVADVRNATKGVLEVQQQLEKATQKVMAKLLDEKS